MKHQFLTIVAGALVASSPLAASAVAPTTTQAKLPIQVEANQMYYGGDSGDVRAAGNVIVTEGPQTLRTELLTGNSKTQTYQAPGTMSFQGEGLDLRGQNATYTGKTGTIAMQQGEGSIQDRFYVRGHDITYVMEKGKEEAKIANGMVTTVHAMAWKNPPDYRLEGESIVMIPNQKITVKEAKFFIRNWHIASMHNYVSYLGRGQGEVTPFDIIPVPTYRSDEGLGLRGGIAQAVGNNGQVFFQYHWTTKVGFKPNIGYTHNFPWGFSTISWRKEKSTINSHNVWVVKRPEWVVQTRNFPIGKTGITVRAKVTAGNWKQGQVLGSHNMQQLEFNHVGIPVGRKTNLFSTLGYQRDHYGFNKANRTMVYWSLRGETKVNDKLTLHAGYYNNNYHGITPYTFDTIDYRRHINYGGYYKIDRLNAVGISYEYNVDDNRLEHEDIFYDRDLHSFTGRLKYRVKDREWQITFRAKDF